MSKPPVIHARAMLLSLIASVVLFGSAPLSGLAQTTPNLGTAAAFAVLGGQTVTNTGPTTVNGSLGVSPGTAVTGILAASVTNGSIHAGDAVAAQAQLDVTTAYNNVAGQPCTSTFPTQAFGNQTLTPGVYCFTSTALLTGPLTLNAQQNPNAVFIFKVASALTTATGSSVAVTGGAGPCNVFWQIGSSATVGTSTVFAGNILALTSITLNTGATVAGRALARNGAVTMDANTISAAACGAAAAPAPTNTATLTFTPSATATSAPSATATSTPTRTIFATIATATAAPTSTTAPVEGISPEVSGPAASLPALPPAALPPAALPPAALPPAALPPAALPPVAPGAPVIVAGQPAQLIALPPSAEVPVVGNQALLPPGAVVDVAGVQVVLAEETPVELIALVPEQAPELVAVVQPAPPTQPARPAQLPNTGVGEGSPAGMLALLGGLALALGLATHRRTLGQLAAADRPPSSKR
jgi:type VI secretion system secreted protein VgrG